MNKYEELRKQYEIVRALSGSYMCSQPKQPKKGNYMNHSITRVLRSFIQFYRNNNPVILHMGKHEVVITNGEEQRSRLLAHDVNVTSLDEFCSCPSNYSETSLILDQIAIRDICVYALDEINHFQDAFRLESDKRMKLEKENATLKKEYEELQEENEQLRSELGCLTGLKPDSEKERLDDDRRRRDSVDKVLSAVSEENRRLWKENDGLLKELNDKCGILLKDSVSLKLENEELKEQLAANRQAFNELIALHKKHEALKAECREKASVENELRFRIDSLEKEAQKQAEFMAYLKQIADKYGKD